MKRYWFLAIGLVTLSLVSSATSPTLSTIQHRSDGAPVKAAKPPTHVAAAVAVTDPVSLPGVCGNGVLEHGEECDCGSPAECAKDPCCNGKTCKLMAGAQCSNLQDCCDKCLFRPSTFICRESTSSCDVVEMCSGKHGKCPSNKKECSKHHSLSSNATDFNSSNVAACGASGCTKDQQCQALSSPTNVLTLSCTQDTSSCQVSCTSGIEINGSLDCQVLPHYYSDGTGCGNSGTCTNGACVGDKSQVSFLQKNIVVLVISSATAAVGLILCCLSIFFLRRRKKVRLEKEEHEKVDAYPMQETFTQRPKSNIRIGLDPVESQPADYFSRAPHLQPSKGCYASDALMSEKELAEELESSQHHQVQVARPGTSAAAAGAWSRKDDNQTGLRSRAGAAAAHSEYIPPPLPPVSVARPISPRVSRLISPYADDAMTVPKVTTSTTAAPSQSQSQPKSGSSSRPSKRSPTGELTSTVGDDTEPSLQQLGNTLTVSGGGLQQDRFSVSSFFSTLALDPEPQPATNVPTSMAHFSSEEFIIPAPVARKVPAPAPTTASPSLSTTTATTAPPVSSASSLSVGPSQVTRRELKQEEIKVATSFAHELGFEIVNPSPATSPQLKNKAPAPSATRPFHRG